ncbi:unnamed protein product [Urochloa humidicola]
MMGREKGEQRRRVSGPPSNRDEGAFGRAAAALEAAGEREAAAAPISPVRFRSRPPPRPPLLYGTFDHWSPPTPLTVPNPGLVTARGAYVASSSAYTCTVVVLLFQTLQVPSACHDYDRRNET